jgi:hypothetical protein
VSGHRRCCCGGETVKCCFTTGEDCAVMGEQECIDAGGAVMPFYYGCNGPCVHTGTQCEWAVNMTWCPDVVAISWYSDAQHPDLNIQHTDGTGTAERQLSLWSGTGTMNYVLKSGAEGTVDGTTQLNCHSDPVCFDPWLGPRMRFQWLSQIGNFQYEKWLFDGGECPMGGYQICPGVADRTGNASVT